MGSVRDVRELVEGLVQHCLTLIPLQTAKQESEKPENRANVQTTVLGEKKMQLKKIKMNSPWGCQTLYMLILPI